MKVKGGWRSPAAHSELASPSSIRPWITVDSFDTAAACEKSLRIPWRCISFTHWIQPRSWNLILSCSAISSSVALALPSSPLLPLVSPYSFCATDNDKAPRSGKILCGELLIFDTNQQFATHRRWG
jgi:hypothetical protein